MQQTPVRIAVDVMGTDDAPTQDVRGAVESLRGSARDAFTLILLGDEERVERELARHADADRSRIRIVHCAGRIPMDAEPVHAVRTMHESSIVRGINLHRDGGADAFVSAGNTGAVMSASTLILGRLPGISRPTIAAQIPSADGFIILADVGANVDSKPRNLFEFGLMSAVYAEEIFGYKNPTVGLLNVGEEAGKGEERVARAYELFRSSKLNFIGNVEGRDLLKAKARVVVCDGFVGNIVLKFAESVPGFLKAKMTDYAASGPIRRMMMGLVRGTLRGILKEMDYQEYGGVPLLGVNGVSIIGHGGSSARAIRNMILKAEEMVRKGVNALISGER